MNHFSHPNKEMLRTLRFIASWICALVIACLLAITSIDAHAQTAPCGAHKSCVIERNDVSKRNALETDGLRSDPADSLIDRGDGRRYWLRCWQKGVLITERITKSPPAESAKVSAVTSSDENAVKVFDLKNATCLMETLPSER
jgi:hypothetical protein